MEGFQQLFVADYYSECDSVRDSGLSFVEERGIDFNFHQSALAMNLSPKIFHLQLFYLNFGNESFSKRFQ